MGPLAADDTMMGRFPHKTVNEGSQGPDLVHNISPPDNGADALAFAKRIKRKSPALAVLF